MNTKISSFARSALGRAAVYAAVVYASSLGVASAQTSDIDVVRQRITDRLLKSVPTQTAIQGYQSTLNPDGSFQGIDYTSHANTGWKPLNHVNQMREMAEAYSKPGQPMYGNAQLKADILKAYDFWVANDTTMIYSDDWYYNQIGVPQAVADTVLLMESQMTSTQITKGMDIAKRATANRSYNQGTNTGANRVWRAGATITRGVIQRNTAVIADAFLAIGDTFTVGDVEGIQRDMSFYQHGNQLYIGGYGSAFIGNSLRWSADAAGTQFAYTEAQQELLTDFLLDGTQYFIRGRVIDYTAMGREISRPGKSDAAAGVINYINDALATGDYRRIELEAFKTRYSSSFSGAGVANPEHALVGNKHFWRADSMTHHRQGFFTSVKTSSIRTIEPEWGHVENLKARHLADGVNLILRSGREYDDIFPVWNWYRLPGTTVAQDNHDLKPDDDWGVYGTSTYAGGVSDGTSGATATSYAKDKVSAKKAWFFFEDMYVALGADIDAPTVGASYSVDTSINQSLRNGRAYYRDGTTVSYATNSTRSNLSELKWVHHDGIAYFFNETPVSGIVKAGPQSGSWSSINGNFSDETISKDIFGLYIQHGTRPNDASYAYTVVPGMAYDQGQMDAYQADSPIQILRNDAVIQSVRHQTLGLTQAAFYEPATLDIEPGFSVTADAASMLMLDRNGSELVISASSPEALAMALHLRVSLPLAGAGAVWDPVLGYTTVTIQLPAGDWAGSTVSGVFQVIPEPGTLAALLLVPLLRRRRR